MAELINAFKSKYTGEQIEELFDMLDSIKDSDETEKPSEIPSLNEGHCYSTAISLIHDGIASGNSVTNPKVETNFGSIQFAGTIPIASNVFSLLSTNSPASFGAAPITYEFKKPVTLLKYKYKGNHYITGAKVNIYYEINNEWVIQGTYTLVQEGVINLESQTTIEKAKVEFTGVNSNCGIYYSIFDFISDEYIISGPSIIAEEITEE